VTILAGFANRLFALPGRLSELGVLPLSEAVSRALLTVGTVSFFVVISVFGLWVIGKFFSNIHVLRDQV